MWIKKKEYHRFLDKILLLEQKYNILHDDCLENKYNVSRHSDDIEKIQRIIKHIAHPISCEFKGMSGELVMYLNGKEYRIKINEFEHCIVDANSLIFERKDNLLYISAYVERYSTYRYE